MDPDPSVSQDSVAPLGFAFRILQRLSVLGEQEKKKKKTAACHELGQQEFVKQDI